MVIVTRENRCVRKHILRRGVGKHTRFVLGRTSSRDLAARAEPRDPRTTYTKFSNHPHRESGEATHSFCGETFFAVATCFFRAAIFFAAAVRFVGAAFFFVVCARRSNPQPGSAAGAIL